MILRSVDDTASYSALRFMCVYVCVGGGGVLQVMSHLSEQMFTTLHGWSLSYRLCWLVGSSSQIPYSTKLGPRLRGLCVSFGHK